MAECIRILHVVSVMNRGGIENMIMNLYRNINRDKIQFDFVVHYNKKGDFDDEIKMLGGNIYYAPHFNIYNIFSYKKWWITFFEKNQEYKIIHSHTYSIASIQHKIAKKFGLKTIVHSHSTKNSQGIKGVIYHCLQKNIVNISDYLFACSRKAGKWLYGVDCEKKSNYYILNNAIEPKKYVFNQSTKNRLLKKFDLDDKFVVGHVGNFTPPKNHLYLIDIFSEIHKKEPNSVLMLVGDGNLRKEIENKIDQLGLKGSVLLLGVRNNVNDLLQVMDCFVFPSLYEGLPVTVIEAQASGLKCFISSNITDEVCITDLVERISINISAKEWADKILNARNYNRKNTEQELISAKYDIHSTAQWLTQFYLDIVEENKNE